MQGGQEVARAAADVEDGLSGRDAGLQHARQVRVEVAPRAARARDAVVVLFVEAADGLDQLIFAVVRVFGASRLGAQSGLTVPRGPTPAEGARHWQNQYWNDA